MAQQSRGTTKPASKTKAAPAAKDEQAVERLAERIRAVLAGGQATEKRMFGGVTFFVNGNMMCTAFKQGLMVRVGTEAEDAALARPFVRRPSKTRKMSGFVFVEPEGIAEKAALARWVGMGRAYVDGLPAKAAKKKR